MGVADLHNKPNARGIRPTAGKCIDAALVLLGRRTAHPYGAESGYNGLMDNRRVIAAMSGGVDSSVAAHLLTEQGYDVTGVFMCMGNAGGAVVHVGDVDVESPACCSPASAENARAAARALGIGFHVLDFSADFARVIDYFADEYTHGRTPNPCARCNEWLKFGRLLQYADAAGAKFVATGHHARIGATAAGFPALLRALDRAKDQSYVLFGLRREALGRVLLPIGEIASKQEVRRLAQHASLPTAETPESQDICFVHGERYSDLLRRLRPEAFRPGPIVDHLGRQVGEHDGVGNFTVGQRKGVRVAAGVPMYVTAIDAETATVTIGPRDEAAGTTLTADRANWHADVGDKPFRAAVQIRYNHEAQRADVQLLGRDRFSVTFDRPIHAITPGQIAAVYDGDRLLGGGWIE